MNTTDASQVRKPERLAAAADETRARLLDTAGEVFAEVGYEAATVREICARAQVNVAAINYHFGNKFQLYLEVLRRSVSPVQKQAAATLFDDSASAGEILKRVIRTMLEIMCGTHRASLYLRLMAHELAQPTPAMPRIIEEATRPMYDRLRGIIGQIIGLDRDDEKTRFCTHSIIGQVIHYAHEAPVLARLWPDLKMTPEQIEKIADHISDFSLAYLESISAGRLKSRSRRKDDARSR